MTCTELSCPAHGLSSLKAPTMVVIEDCIDCEGVCFTTADRNRVTNDERIISAWYYELTERELTALLWG